MSKGYLATAREVYREAALEPKVGLCCTTTPVWKLPGLSIPKKMLEMNYGCGATVHPRDLAGHPTVLYVGVGGGMELLQFAYFVRRSGGVIGIDPVPEMLQVCRGNLDRAVAENPWLQPDFVELREGDALRLPAEDSSVEVAAQNCLFNIFREEEFLAALREMRRVLKPGGRLLLSDPICEQEIPTALRNDERLRAECLSGAVSLSRYLATLAEAGFGTIEVRARRPYRVLDPVRYQTPELIYVESVEICALNDPVQEDGPCVFTGRTAIYFGSEEAFDDGRGHRLLPNTPLPICDKTAGVFEKLNRDDLLVTSSTWFYDGGGCC